MRQSVSGYVVGVVSAWTSLLDVPGPRDGTAFDGALPVALFNAQPSIATPRGGSRNMRDKF